MVTARIFADLVDLQKKIASIVGKFKPGDTCANKGAEPNPVMSLKSSTLWPRSDQLVMFLRGHIDMWSCVAGPRRPRRVTCRRRSLHQVQDGRAAHCQRSEEEQERHAAVRRNVARYPDEDGGRQGLARGHQALPQARGGYSDTVLKRANADLNKSALSALQSAIDPEKLKAALPKELQKLNMSVQSARFRDYGGHAIAEINLGATISGSSPLRQQVLTD